MFTFKSNEYNFDFNNYNSMDNSFNYFDFTTEAKNVMGEHLSLTEIKSTEEFSNRNYSSLSLIAEENDYREVVSPVGKYKSHTNKSINKIAEELHCKINEGSIEEVIAEALDFQFWTETEETRPIQQKRKKSDSQVKSLEKALEQNKSWTKEYMNNLAAKLGLSRRQVYKWHWDKTQKKAKKESNKRLNKSRPNKFEDIETSLGLTF